MADPNSNSVDDIRLLSPLPEQEVARRWQKSVRTLQRFRRDGYGPAYLRIGSTIYYRMNDVLAFEASMRSDSRDAK